MYHVSYLGSTFPQKPPNLSTLALLLYSNHVVMVTITRLCCRLQCCHVLCIKCKVTTVAQCVRALNRNAELVGSNSAKILFFERFFSIFLGFSTKSVS